MTATGRVCRVCRRYLQDALAHHQDAELSESFSVHLERLCQIIGASLASGRFDRRWCAYNDLAPESPQSLDAYVGQVVANYLQDWRQVNALRQGDDGAWQQLRRQALIRCTRTLLASGWSWHAASDDAETLCQEFSLRLLTDLDRFSFDVLFRRRWPAILDNVLYRFFHQFRRQDHQPLISELLEGLEDRKAVYSLERVEMRLGLQAAIDQLPSPAQRQAILLELRDDLPVPLIAEQMGVSAQAVYNLRHRARSQLRVLLTA